MFRAFFTLVLFPIEAQLCSSLSQEMLVLHPLPKALGSQSKGHQSRLPFLPERNDDFFLPQHWFGLIAIRQMPEKL